MINIIYIGYNSEPSFWNTFKDIYSKTSYTRVGTLIVTTIYLQLIQNRYCFEVLLSFIVVTSTVYNPLPAMWKS